MEPLKTSQYAEAEEGGQGPKENNTKYINTILIVVLLILFIVMLAVFILTLRISAKSAIIMLVHLLIPTVMTLLATRLTAGLARRNLGGMSGDIAGFSICMGELIGLITLALMRWLLL